MNQVFKRLIVSDIVVKDIDLYGCIVNINRRLSNDIVRKRLANCFVYDKKHEKHEQVNGYRLCQGVTSHWLGYLLHRDNDLPAFIDGDEQIWYQNGKLHRDGDLPAVIHVNYITQYWAWYQYGKLHRDNDQPAVTCGNSIKEWYKNGELHRDNDKPAIISGNARKWYKNGKQYYPDFEK